MGDFSIVGTIAGAGPWALAMLIIVALLRGDLLPRKVHDAEIAQRDQTILDMTSDRNYYRTHTLQLLGLAERADVVTQVLLREGVVQQQTGPP